MSKLDVTDNLIEKLQESKRTAILVATDGREFSQEELFPLPEVPIVRREKITPLTVSTLDALIEYVKSGVDDNAKNKLLIHVQSHDRVVLYTGIFGAERERDVYVIAQWSSLFSTAFQFDRFITQEQFVIGCRTLFEQSSEEGGRSAIDQVVALAANITDVASLNKVDNGTNQTVTVRTGIAKEDNVEVNNPYSLRPFRTFRDIRQPESPFLLRFQAPDKAGLFEADAQNWKHDAIRSIRVYLDAALNPAAGSSADASSPRIPILG